MKSYKIELKWAVIFALMLLSWMLIEKLAGLHGKHIDKHMIYTNFVAIPAITIYVFALLDKRKSFYNGQMNYMQGFLSGMIITLIVTALSPVVQYITSIYITPEYFPNVIKYAVSQKMMTLKEAEANFNLQSYMLQATIGAFIMGTITSAIVAIFTQRKSK